MLSVLDLFCGAGGFSEGFRQAGFRIVAGTDVDPDACATYAHNYPDAVTVCGNLTKEATRSRVVDAAVAVDVVVGGPPCQAFSQVRNHDRALDDPRNRLYREFLRMLERVEPRAFVMENVLGLAQLRVQERIAQDLLLSGKYCVSVQEVDACDFGVPQTRKRLLFVGLRTSLGVLPPKLRGSGASEHLLLTRTENGSVGYRPAPCGLSGRRFLERLLDNKDASIVTTRQAISDLRSFDPGSGLMICQMKTSFGGVCLPAVDANRGRRVQRQRPANQRRHGAPPLRHPGGRQLPGPASRPP